MFHDLPATPILTLAMDTPPSWIVRPESSPHDLDNLVLGNDREPIHIAFNLNQLLIEGHAREANNAPPRGLQLQLTDKSYNAISDTQVMANLGYFQFKATPGVYQLAIRPGRGTEVYELESVGTQGWDSLGVNVTGTNVALTSFEGATILPRFERRKGMEMENVLDESAPAQAPSVVGSVFTRYEPAVQPRAETGY
jgi:UDP-glucose:glycoprotein glucosyltransferase